MPCVSLPVPDPLRFHLRAGRSYGCICMLYPRSGLAAEAVTVAVRCRSVELLSILHTPRLLWYLLLLVVSSVFCCPLLRPAFSTVCFMISSYLTGPLTAATAAASVLRSPERSVHVVPLNRYLCPHAYTFVRAAFQNLLRFRLSTPPWRCVIRSTDSLTEGQAAES